MPALLVCCKGRFHIGPPPRHSPRPRQTQPLAASATAPAARSEAERAGVEIRRFPLAPMSSSAPSDAGAQPFDHRGKAQGRRGLRTGTDRFARPPSCQTLRCKRKVWHHAPFLLDRARPVFFSARRKENGGCIPRETPGVPPGPPGKTPDESRKQIAPLTRHLLRKCHLTTVAAKRFPGTFRARQSCRFLERGSPRQEPPCGRLRSETRLRAQ